MTKTGDRVNAIPLDISDQDIYAAMKEIPGYLDITPGDFKDLYALVYRQAVQRIVESVKASDIMTKTVVAVGPMMSVQQAASLMADRGVSGVPVVDESNAVVGVLSERDFLFRMGSDKRKTFMDVVARCLEAKNCAAIAIRAKNVEDIMSSPAVVIEENTGLLEITALLKKKQINRVPVVDANKKMVGIVSREDIVHASIVPGL